MSTPRRSPWGRRIARWLWYGGVGAAAGGSARLIQSLWSGEPRFADEWPWLIGVPAVAVPVLIIAGRLAGGSSQAPAPADLEPPLDDPSMDLARRLARSGKRIQAVTMVRRLTGASLSEARAVVKSMEREPAPE